MGAAKGWALGAAAVAALAAGVADANPDAAREHAKADAELAKAAADVCGRRVSAHIDWHAFSALDFKAQGNDPPSDWMMAMRGSLENMHGGVANACRDPGMKALLAKAEAIVFVPTGDKSYTLDASLVESTLTFTDYIFGSTRDQDDWLHAIRDAQVPAAGPAAPAKLGTPSGKWDAPYESYSFASSDSLCPSTDGMAPVKVSGGKFTIPWRIREFRGHRGHDDDDDDDRGGPRGLEVGTISGVVHADGTAIGVVTFSNPALDDPEPRTVKVKQRLASVQSLAIAFARNDDGRQFTFDIPLGGHSAGDEPCHYSFEWRDPKIAAARQRAYERAEAAKTPAQRARERKEAQDRQAAEDKERAENDAKRTRISHCRSRCEEHKDTCRSRCSSGGDWTCANQCDKDEEECKDDCEKD